MMEAASRRSGNSGFAQALKVVFNRNFRLQPNHPPIRLYHVRVAGNNSNNVTALLPFSHRFHPNLLRHLQLPFI